TTTSQRQENRAVDRENYDGKVNWNRTSSHQIWAKFSHMRAIVDDLTNYLGPDPNASGDGGNTKVYQVTAGQTWTLGPTLLMDSTFGFSRQKQEVLGPDFNAGNFGLDVLGIPGTNDQGIGDQRYAGYPQFDLSTVAGGVPTGFSQLGNRDGWNPIFRDERTYSVATSVTKVAGQHDFRGGYFLNFLYLDHWQPETDNPRGRFRFHGATPALDGRGLDRLDLTTLDVIIAGRGGNPQNNGMKAALNNFAPRVGGVYRINENTVVRTGYGLTYNAQGWARAVRGDNDYPITIASQFLNANDRTGFGYYGTLQQGIPIIRGPDLSSGRVPLDRSAAEYTPEIDNIDRGYIQTWNAAIQRRLPFDTSVDVAYVGAKGTGGYAALDINAPTVLGGGTPSRPYFALGRSLAINSWGQRLRTRYNSLQIALNKPFTHG